MACLQAQQILRSQLAPISDIGITVGDFWYLPVSFKVWPWRRSTTAAWTAAEAPSGAHMLDRRLADWGIVAVNGMKLGFGDGMAMMRSGRLSSWWCSRVYVTVRTFDMLVANANTWDMRGIVGASTRTTHPLRVLAGQRMRIPFGIGLASGQPNLGVGDRSV